MNPCPLVLGSETTAVDLAATATTVFGTCRRLSATTLTLTDVPSPAAAATDLSHLKDGNFVRISGRILVPQQLDLFADASV